MREKLTANARRVTSTFSSFTAGQKAVTIFAVAALAIGGYFFATWASKPTYAPLFSGLAPADASAIVDKLNADGIEYQLTNGGQTIEVPQDQVYAERIKLSGEGLPAQTDGAGYSLLDNQGVMTSDFMQQVSYQRAMEGELANTIKAMSGVNNATVHLAIPQKDVFSDDQQAPTASVMIATAAGKKLSSSQVDSVVHLVSSSISGLTTDKVTVVGSDGKVLSDTADGGGSDARSQQTSSYEQRLAASVQSMLDQVVGTGHAVVQVTADLDYDQTETKSETFVADPSVPPLAESTKTETYTNGGTAVGGVLGPDNIQVPAGTDGTGSYTGETATRNNAVGKITETRKAAPGAVKKLSVAVLLDSKTAAGANEAQVQQLVSSAVGLDATRGDSIAVSALAFDASDEEASKAEEAAQAKAEQQAKMMTLIKEGGLVGAVVLLLLIAMLNNRRKNKKLQKLLKAEVTQSAKLDAAVDAARLALENENTLAIESAPDPLAIERDARREEIASLVEQQPEEVAQLLRSWLADRRA